MKSAKGFTLTEAIIILVIVAILAAIAVPKYLAIRDEKMLKTAHNFANEMAIASALNYKQCKTGDASSCKKTVSCSDFATLLPEKLPRRMSIVLKQATPFPADAGQEVECQIIFGSTPVDFKAIANP